MKNRWIVAACAAVCWTASAQTTAPYAPAPENLQARTAFQDAKFGIFLHWGLYSIPTRRSSDLSARANGR